MAQWYENAFGRTNSSLSRDYTKAVNAALDDSDTIWKDNQTLVSDALRDLSGNDRTIASSLNKYDTSMGDIKSNLMTSMNPVDNYGSYVNPSLEYQNQQITDAVQGASGAALQSSGTQNAVNKAVAENTQQNYNSAVNKALQDASNNLNIEQQMASQAEDVLTADSTPEQDLIAMNQDWATDRLNTVVQLANFVANTKSNDYGWLGNLIKGATSSFTS